jgi:hypothetical protein
MWHIVVVAYIHNNAIIIQGEIFTFSEERKRGGN